MQFSTVAAIGFATLGAAQENTCHQDNCYRDFNDEAFKPSAQSFCSEFTTTSVLTANFPSYVTVCSAVSEISSVCSCAYPAIITSTRKITGSPITLPLITSVSRKPTACPTIGSCFNSISSSISSKLSLRLSSSLSSSLSMSLSSNILSSSAHSSISSFQTSTTTPVGGKQYGPGCHADNCLRAFDRGNSQAFCSAFTAGISTALPSYVTQCVSSNTVSQVSSACTCLNGGLSPALATPTSSRLLTSSTKTTRTSTIIVVPALLPPKCNSDNCLRAMKREGGVGVYWILLFFLNGSSYQISRATNLCNTMCYECHLAD